MRYFTHLFQIIKVGYLFTRCEIPDNFLPKNNKSLLNKLLNYNKINFPKANQKVKNNVNEVIREKMKAVRLIQCYDKYEDPSNTSQ